MERKWCEENVVKKTDEIGDVARKESSGRPKSVLTEDNKKLAEEMILT